MKASRVAVGADHRAARRRPRRRPVSTASMISCLKGWSAKSSRPSSSVCSWRTKGWSSAMISRISASMRSRSSSLKCAPSGQLEVVVEAVLDHRADGVVGARPQPEHGLGQHVGGRVAQHVPAGVGVGGDDGHLRRRRAAAASRSTSRPSTVAATAALARRGPMDCGQLGGRRALGELPRRAVGKTNRDDACHRAPFPAQPARSLLVRTPFVVPQGYWTTPSAPTHRRSERRRRAGAPRRPPAARRPPPRRGRASAAGRVEVVVERGPHRAPARPSPSPSPGALAPQRQAGRRRGHVLAGAPVPVLAGSGGRAGPAARRPGPTPCTGRRRRRGCRATWTSWCRPGRPGPTWNQCRTNGSPGDRLGLGRLALVVREDEVAPAAVDVDRLAELAQGQGRALDVPARAGPVPSATPTPARRAATAARARSRAGRACSGRRGARRARRPARACRPGRSR